MRINLSMTFVGFLCALTAIACDSVAPSDINGYSDDGTEQTPDSGTTTPDDAFTDVPDDSGAGDTGETDDSENTDGQDTGSSVDTGLGSDGATDTATERDDSPDTDTAMDTEMDTAIDTAIDTEICCPADDPNCVCCIDNDTDFFCIPFDCNDSDAAISPDADEIPGNGLDENCDASDLN